MSTATAEVLNGNGAASSARNGTQQQTRAVSDGSAFSSLLDTAKFEHLYRVATAFARSTLVPTQFQNNIDNCFVALQMALRLQIDPFMFLQGCYVVHGRPGIEAKLAIALANKSGVFRSGISFRMEGEGMNRCCVAHAARTDTGEVVEEKVTMQMAKAEGWIDKNGSKWKTIPDLMLKYRAAMFLIRLTCPEVLLGMQSAEELEDITSDDASTIVSTVAPRKLDELTDRLMQPVTAHQSAPETPSVEAAVEQTPYEQFKAELLATTTNKAAKDVYDEWFGPTAKHEFESALNTEALQLMSKQQESFKKKKSGTDLFDNKQPSAVEQGQ